jgi:hypothetical protein
LHIFCKLHIFANHHHDDLTPLWCCIFIFVCYLHIPVNFIFQSCSFSHYQPNSPKKLLLRKLEKNLFQWSESKGASPPII